MGGVVKHRSGLSRWLGIVAASSVCLALAACQQGIETAGKVDAPGVPVAFDTIEGAPDAVLSKVSAEVAPRLRPGGSSSSRARASPATGSRAI